MKDVFFNKWHLFLGGGARRIGKSPDSMILFVSGHPEFPCFSLFPSPPGLQGVPPPSLEKQSHPNAVLPVFHAFSNPFL